MLVRGCHESSDQALVSGVKDKGLMVDTGATSQMVRDIAQCSVNVLELADGDQTSTIVLKKSTARVSLRDTKG